VEEEDIVDMQQIKKNGRDYYEYELFTPYAEAGSHNLTTVCTSMNYLVMATISANEKQWEKSEKILRRVLHSFEVEAIKT